MSAALLFSEERFPVDISYGATGGPHFTTHVVSLASGHEVRHMAWHHARARYNVAHGVKNEEQFQRLLAFFRARAGRAIGFRFKDWMDYRATHALLGVGDGVQTRFACITHYHTEHETIARRIHKPVSETMALALNGAPLSATQFRVDTIEGMVELHEAAQQGARLEASYEFDVPVRFDTDHLNAQMLSDHVYGWQHIPLVEIRL